MWNNDMKQFIIVEHLQNHYLALNIASYKQLCLFFPDFWAVSSSPDFNAVSLPVPQGRWQTQMQQLRDMGIRDEELALRALQATDGDLQAALELIFAGGGGLWDSEEIL